jgi:hypothetical protein
MRNAYKISVKKPEGKRPLERLTWHRWENNIKIYLKVIGCELDSCGTGKGKAVGPYEHGNEPSGFTKGGEFLNQLSNYQLLNKDSVSLSQLSISEEITTTWHCENGYSGHFLKTFSNVSFTTDMSGRQLHDYGNLQHLLHNEMHTIVEKKVLTAIN